MSPAAAEVVRLQAQLLELQGREVQQLSAEVAGLAGAGERLAALREQHEVLEREADEAFVLQSQLPELEVAAAQVVMLRRRRDALEVERAQVRSRLHLSERWWRMHFLFWLKHQMAVSRIQRLLSKLFGSYSMNNVPCFCPFVDACRSSAWRQIFARPRPPSRGCPGCKPGCWSSSSRRVKWSGYCPSWLKLQPSR